MTSPVQTPFLERQKQLWKARAQAKQKWLEQSLAQPARTSGDAALRMTWVKQALNMVKRRQAEIEYHAALMDACTEHLSVLEMTLIAATEQKRSTEAAANPSVETAEQKRSKRPQT
jgi:Mn-containing catalase